MQRNTVIRDQVGADATGIAEVTVAAFSTLAISQHTEQFIIEALRAAKALTVSLVAELDRKIVGHVAFSPVTLYVLVGISPLGQKRKLATVIDASATAFATIFVSAGRRGLEIELAPSDLCSLTKGTFAVIGR